MTITGISSAVDTRLKAIQSDGAAVFVDVKNAPTDSVDDFSGYPSCTHFYFNTDSDYSTAEKNENVINYEIFIYLLSPTKSLSTLYQEMYEYIDLLIAEFKEHDDLDGACDFLRPVPAELTRESTERGKGLIARVSLACVAK